MFPLKNQELSLENNLYYVYKIESMRVCLFVCLFVCLLLVGGFLFSLRSVLRNREDLHFWKNWMMALMACVRLYSLYNFVCLSLCESDGCGPYRNHHRPPQRFCSFQDYLRFWKNWITAPVAGQRHNNVVVFSFGSVLRLLLGSDNNEVVSVP
jgi:hypothetical protein